MITKKDCRKIADWVFTDSCGVRCDDEISELTGVDYKDVDSFLNMVYKMIDEMPDDPKPCPFCDSEHVELVTGIRNVTVRCNECYALGPEVKYDCTDEWEWAKEEAIKLWNKRTDDNE